MANLYLVLDDAARVRGSQTTKGTIDQPGYVLVDEKAYNDFGKLKEYESMTYDAETRKFTAYPDPRPQLRITAPASVKLGEPVDLVAVDIEQLSQGKGEKAISESSAILIEYECPDGRVGLVRVSFSKGAAGCSFTPDKSGYYRFGGSANYKAEQDIIIAVYEE